MILINVTLAANPGQEAAFTTLLIDTMAASRAEDGCIEYRYSADLEQAGRFHLIELWRDEVALTAHFQAPAFRHFITAIATLGQVVSSVAHSGELSPYTIQR